MSRQQSQSGGGLIGAIGVLFLIGLIIKYIWWILAALGLVLTFWIIAACVRHYQSVEAARQRRAAEIAARADQQHRWVLDGDHRGIYGEDGAELMRYSDVTTGSESPGGRVSGVSIRSIPTNIRGSR